MFYNNVTIYDLLELEKSVTRLEELLPIHKDFTIETGEEAEEVFNELDSFDKLEILQLVQKAGMILHKVKSIKILEDRQCSI